MEKNHKQRAMLLFKEGYNCSQSVFAAFHEELGIDLETALKISSSFGAGVGRLREVCGAVTGMFMVAGMKYGYTDPKDHKNKTMHYKRIQDLADQFKVDNPSIVCRDLLGLGKGASNPEPEKRSDAYYKKRPCIELVGQAAQLIEEMIEEELKNSLIEVKR